LITLAKVSHNLDQKLVTMLEIINIKRQFGRRHVLTDVTFDVAPGEIVGLLGANGAGKTTLMRILAGFYEPTAGDIVFGGESSFTLGVNYRRMVGYLPERSPLYDEMRVNDYLHFRARLRGLKVRRARRRVREVLKECKLENISRQRISTLSLGWRRLTGLADALLSHPRILLLDDPLAGLDPEHNHMVRQIIVSASARAAIIVSGHGLHDLIEICSRYVILRNGRLAATLRCTDLPTGKSAEKLAQLISGADKDKAALQSRGGDQ
jgi:ABC-2 type transport system ATP-binding protein